MVLNLHVPLAWNKDRREEYRLEGGPKKSSLYLLYSVQHGDVNDVNIKCTLCASGLTFPPTVPSLCEEVLMIVGLNYTCNSVVLGKTDYRNTFSLSPRRGSETAVCCCRVGGMKPGTFCVAGRFLPLCCSSHNRLWLSITRMTTSFKLTNVGPRPSNSSSFNLKL